MDFGMILALPFMLVMGIPIGFIRIFTDFGILFALPGLLLILGAFIVNKYQKIRAALVLVLTAVLGQWFSLLSWIVSRRSIEPVEAVHQWGMNMPSVAKAGFPISTLELPPSPMGSDIVPIDMWGGVSTNHLIWFLVAFVMVLLLVLRKKIGFDKKVLFTCAVLTLLAVVYNLALFTLWYD